MPVRAPLKPGAQTPRRQVPPTIQRPEYVDRPAPQRNVDPDVQPPEVIEAMRRACKIAAQALEVAGKEVRPGITTDRIDAVVHEFFVDNEVYPSTLGYRGFPKSCCTSLNEVICHGIPDSTVIEDGDIVNVDVTGYVGGVHGDTNATFLAGEVSEEVRLLVERTQEATLRGIRAAKPGRRLNVIGRVIESYAKRFGYGVVRDFTGHGIGRSFHSGLVVLHYDEPSVQTVLEPGMTFTVEPMITLGTHEYDLWDDGWTVTTKDKSWTAQFEHTILITEDGNEILTKP
jgi:methionyl aminopeptidase